MKQDYTPRKLSNEEFSQLWRDFLDSDYKKEQKDEIFALLDRFFLEADDETIQQFRGTFWKLYVYALWDRMSGLPDTTVAMMYEKTVLDALILEIDVMNAMMWDLGVTVTKREAMPQRYNTFRDSFLHSQFNLSYQSNTVVTQEAFVKQVKVLSAKRGDSLTLAEAYNKLEQDLGLSQRLANEPSTMSGQDAISLFVSLVTFLDGITSEKIDVFVDGIINGLEHETLKNDIGHQEYEKLVSGEYDQELKKIEKEFEEGTRAPDPSSIREVIEQRIASAGPNAKPELFDEGILRILQRFADDYNDQSIAQLYYFDEEAGSFVWDPRTES